jgi:ubiquinone/menaquinone biosynthesis C-methylase UbiE
MKTAFDQEVARHYDRWYETDIGRYISSLEERLTRELIGDVRGRRILDIGCGTGNHLKLFQSWGSQPVGVDSSLFMLQKAKSKGDPKLILANGEQLPLKNLVFDVTTLITTLEFCEKPIRILQEAGRVTRERILIGVLNSWSILAIGRRVKAWFKPSIYKRADFSSIWKLKRLLRNSVAFESLEWKGVHSIPCARTRFLRWLDRKLSFRRNPFAAFLGILITLKRGSSA